MALFCLPLIKCRLKVHLIELPTHWLLFGHEFRQSTEHSDARTNATDLNGKTGKQRHNHHSSNQMTILNQWLHLLPCFQHTPWLSHIPWMTTNGGIRLIKGYRQLLIRFRVILMTIEVSRLRCTFCFVCSRFFFGLRPAATPAAFAVQYIKRYNSYCYRIGNI